MCRWVDLCFIITYSLCVPEPHQIPIIRPTFSQNALGWRNVCPYDLQISYFFVQNRVKILSHYSVTDEIPHVFHHIFFKHYSPDQHASVHLEIVVTNSTIQPVKIIVPADKTSTGLQFVKSGTVSCDILGGYICNCLYWLFFTFFHMLSYSTKYGYYSYF